MEHSKEDISRFIPIHFLFFIRTIHKKTRGYFLDLIKLVFTASLLDVMDR